MGNQPSRLARIRAAKDLTQRELAERAGLDEETVRRIEAGLTRPRLRTCYRLARALDCEVQGLWPELAEEAAS